MKTTSHKPTSKKLSSPIPWVGGKRLLRESIISQIPEHHCYVELFAGAAWVFWGKQPSEVEIINDIDSNLVNLYRQIQDRPEEFYEKVWYMLTSREEYKRYLTLLTDYPHTLTEMQRAVYYFYVIKHAFGGRFGGGFSFSKHQPPRSALNRDGLLALSDRLKTVFVENLPYERVLKNYDSRETFFYCDPPYVVADGKDYYRYCFSEEQHVQLRDRLTKIAGKFLLSYDDVPLIRQLYKNFHIETTEPVHYTMSKNHPKKHELLIRNY